MTHRCIISGVLALLLGCATGSAFAQERAPLAKADIAKIETEVRIAGDTYFRLLSEGKPNEVAENIFNHPSFSISANGVTITDPKAQAASLTAFTGKLREAGWDKSVWSNPAVCVMNANAAVLSGKFVRYKKDGSILNEDAEAIVYARTKNGWRIATIMNHAQDLGLRCAD